MASTEEILALIAEAVSGDGSVDLNPGAALAATTATATPGTPSGHPSSSHRLPATLRESSVPPGRGGTAACSFFFFPDRSQLATLTTLANDRFRLSHRNFIRTVTEAMTPTLHHCHLRR